MLGDDYAIRGLDALSRAHETNYFADGHRGAAMLAAYFLCRELEVEDGVVDIVRAMLDEHWTDTPLCAPFPRESAEPGLACEITRAFESMLSGLRQAGHNVILPTMALKGFRQFPALLTPSRAAGVCKLIEAFTTSDDIHLDDGDAIPDVTGTADAAEFILSEFLDAAEKFDGRGQGWSGHLLTYGRALFDLRQLGYDDLADKASGEFKLYIKRIRMGPLDTDTPRAEHSVSERLAHQRAYWEGRRSGSVGIGHVFKYPYGFCGLLALAADADLRQRCMAAAWRVL